jgi:hypothetical protein
MARVEIAHMRVSSGHKVALLLSEDEMQYLLAVLRAGIGARDRGGVFRSYAEKTFLHQLRQAVDRLEASVTSPIEPNDA